MIRLATIGTSSITEQFIAATRFDERIRLCAVYSRNEQTGKAFAQKHGADAVFTNLEELALYEGIDAVYIASPNFLHAKQSRLFLENGKHVICEKPITTCLKEYEELKNTADKNGVIYIEAITSFYTSTKHFALEGLKEIGNIALARIDYSQRSSRLDRFLEGETPNIFNMSLHAGTLNDIGVYCVWGAVQFFGEPKNITASASFLRGGADGSGCAIFDYGDFSAMLTYSKTGQSAIGTEIIGQKGTLKIGLISQLSDISLVKDGEQILCGKQSRPELMSGEASAFADFIEGKALELYREADRQTRIVHKCMDIIKEKANIKYI